MMWKKSLIAILIYFIYKQEKNVAAASPEHNPQDSSLTVENILEINRCAAVDVAQKERKAQRRRQRRQEVRNRSFF
jgi:hypothetical protein